MYYLVNQVHYVPRRKAIQVTYAADVRRTATPNATMLTLASPTLGASHGIVMWEVQMRAGARGPVHSFDSEQVWTVLDGRMIATVGGEAIELCPGDTMVMPPELPRQVVAAEALKAIVCGHAGAVASVPGEGRPRGTPPWIA